jgi:5-(carboxyamino)imidazole ribonucleotide synthase
VNCIGTMPDGKAIAAIPGAHLHDYMKSARPGRKLGHVTVTATDPAALEAPLLRVRELCDRAGLA